MKALALRENSLIEHFRKHGTSSVSFLSLYEGYQYFSISDGAVNGVIAYIETPSAWIAAGDPVAPFSDWRELLNRFRTQAVSRGKAVLFLPASEKCKDVAAELGWKFYCIGSEPWHELAVEHLTPLESRELNPAKQFRSKGAVIEKFSPGKISVSENLELQEISREWLETRKTDALSFLNRLEPWTLAEHKRYYWVKHNDKIYGFLAAVPVWGTNGWYLVDLIRRTRAPLGSTELLVTEAIKDLKKEGADRVTLGFSPLAKLDEAPHTGSALALKIGQWLFKRGGMLYSFQSLFEYKAKFKPDRWEPKYLLAGPHGMGAREWMALSKALYPRGAIPTALSWVRRLFKRMNLSSKIENGFSKDLVCRPIPVSFLEFLERVKATAFLTALSIFSFIGSTGNTGTIREKMLFHYGFSYQKFITSGWSVDTLKSIMVSPMLFFEPKHFVCSLIALLLGVGLLEIFAGSAFAFATFAVGSYSIWPVTAVFNFVLVSPFFQSYYEKIVDLHRIGPSLGIVACFGALHYLAAGSTKRRWGSILILLIVGCLFAPQYCISHLLAFFAGYGFIRVRLPKYDLLFKV